MSRRVILLSPYKGEFELRYARACMHNAIKREEFPISPMLLFTQPGVDPPKKHVPNLTANLILPWLQVAVAITVYADLGLDDVMERVLILANAWRVPVSWRELGHPWTAENCFGMPIADDVPENTWPTTAYEAIEPFSTDLWGLPKPEAVTDQASCESSNALLRTPD